MSVASWYHHHYSAWNRARRLPQPPFVARGDGDGAQNGRDGIPAVNMAAIGSNDINGNNKNKKSQDPLFGPNIGVVSSGPAWTSLNEKKVFTDELTSDVVRGWVEKSKETSHPTTTLQALVNLKRPTIRLSPLTPEDPTSPAPHHHHHYGLEFEYDCDAPKCGIYVHVLLPQEHPDAPATSSASGLSKLLIFETVVEGAFRKVLKLEEGALLELGRFEHVPTGHAGGNGSTPSLNGAIPSDGDPHPSGDLGSPSTDSNNAPASGNSRNARRRFTHFHFRKRPQGRSVSGPALALVDVEPPTTDTKSKDAKEDVVDGVRVLIRLAALDEQGTELASPNEQVTYLHVVRLGAEPGNEEAEAEGDTRPWVVRVVKREATIGPHTFHLHEIYGLTSSSTTHTPPSTAPLSPVPNSPHTYPPSTPTALQLPPASPEEETSSECLLCLSSPREVVLLPCRHLVACKDCAMNMVEFGAGGNITHQIEEPVPAPTTETAEAAEGTYPATPVITPTPNTRRKRKAKGWFCPVCRQPYTSLLRITTSAPLTLSEGDKEAASALAGDDSEASALVTPGSNTVVGEGTPVRGGILGGNFAPSFLRGLSLSRNLAPDLENQAGTARVGA